MLKQDDANVDRILMEERAVNVNLAFGTSLIVNDASAMVMLKVVIPRLVRVSIAEIILLDTIVIDALRHIMVILGSVWTFHVERVLAQV